MTPTDKTEEFLAGWRVGRTEGLSLFHVDQDALTMYKVDLAYAQAKIRRIRVRGTVLFLTQMVLIVVLAVTS